YEDDDFAVIFDAGPATLGHALILPKEHYANIYEIDEYSYKVSQNTGYFWNSCATDLKSLIMMNYRR
ncbi:MAG: HIT domain-containing protein, partial [Bacteroidales bacterium]|nr:HIT domain-containing protein [Bacteroidales bacterium]